MQSKNDHLGIFHCYSIMYTIMFYNVHYKLYSIMYTIILQIDYTPTNWYLHQKTTLSDSGILLAMAPQPFLFTPGVL